MLFEISSELCPELLGVPTFIVFEAHLICNGAERCLYVFALLIDFNLAIRSLVDGDVIEQCRLAISKLFDKMTTKILGIPFLFNNKIASFGYSVIIALALRKTRNTSTCPLSAISIMYSPAISDFFAIP